MANDPRDFIPWSSGSDDTSPTPPIAEPTARNTSAASWRPPVQSAPKKAKTSGAKSQDVRKLNRVTAIAVSTTAVAALAIGTGLATASTLAASGDAGNVVSEDVVSLNTPTSRGDVGSGDSSSWFGDRSDDHDDDDDDDDESGWTIAPRDQNDSAAGSSRGGNHGSSGQS